MAYIKIISGNEALLEECISAIQEGKCVVKTDFPNPYALALGEGFLNVVVIEYYLENSVVRGY